MTLFDLGLCCGKTSPEPLAPMEATISEQSSKKSSASQNRQPPTFHYLAGGGHWPLADCWYGNGWSIAYRVLDAQFWGTPQRRRRIALVADFGGHAALEILFVRKGVSGNFEQSGETRENAPGRTAKSSNPPVAHCLRGSGELAFREDMDTLILQEQAIPINDKATRFKGGGATRNGDGAGNGLGVGKPGDPSPTLTAADRHIVFATQQFAGYKESTVASCMQSRQYKDATDIVFTPIPPDVRRLTPLECERLQGFPDGWTDIGEWVDEKGKHHPGSSDAARYRALGNSIAIPPWKWVIKRLCAVYERNATMASLFDGIGGFPYIWEQINGKGSCLWASEIEPFPIAVTKYHFGE